MNEKSDKDEVAGTNRNADDIERQLAGTQTHSLNLKSGMSTELQRWTEELFFYEQAFPKYDELGRVLVATPGRNTPDRSAVVCTQKQQIL